MFFQILATIHGHLTSEGQQLHGKAQTNCWGCKEAVGSGRNFKEAPVVKYGLQELDSGGTCPLGMANQLKGSFPDFCRVVMWLFVELCEVKELACCDIGDANCLTL